MPSDTIVVPSTESTKPEVGSDIDLEFEILPPQDHKPVTYAGPAAIVGLGPRGMVLMMTRLEDEETARRAVYDTEALVAERSDKPNGDGDGGTFMPQSDEPDAPATMPGGGQRSAVTLNFDTPFDGFAQVITADHTGPVVVFGVTARGEAVMLGKIDDETRAQWNREASQIGGHA